MKKEPLAYHAVAHALEAKSGWTPQRRFASSVAHAINGHLPYARHHAAGRERARQGIGEEGVCRLVRDFLDTDINPAVSFISPLIRPASALSAFNAYNAAAQLGVRTNVDAHDPTLGGIARLRATRSQASPLDDPEPCRIESPRV
ncbi:hypothetical protein ASF61_06975 [Duganella sp. Leaf126]|uniref:hypothetical protein n=1 Tax=Duganella sp. Leaf126 TaxID=1736266 RepID=UPI000700108E|nr:hypothetical protein [Duganella sp. Leaf126]KQQ40486.1 hypothetical protein ASF61_06975 [Duganella sp. Leaf126]